MAQIKTDSAHYQNIANKIREKTGSAETYYPAEMPNGVDEVYEAGKKAEYDAFWDNFQQNGKRTYYYDGFNNQGKGWTLENFKPKYDLICTSAEQMFYSWGDKTWQLDFGALLKQQGIRFDVSQCLNLNNLFAYGYNFVGEFPVISCESAANKTTRMFHGCLVSKIEKVIVTEQTIYDNWFLYCSELRDIVFEGVIANSISLSYSKLLTIESLKSIITHLKNYAGTEQESTKTITLATDSKTLLNTEGATSPNGNTWTNYIGDLGWVLK